jgi:hypothetical protein
LSGDFATGTIGIIFAEIVKGTVNNYSGLQTHIDPLSSPGTLVNGFKSDKTALWHDAWIFRCVAGNYLPLVAWVLKIIRWT